MGSGPSAHSAIAARKSQRPNQITDDATGRSRPGSGPCAAGVVVDAGEVDADLQQHHAQQRQHASA